ncbi:hypothetical protein NQ318_012960 [Aromia moschata]|uniref:C-type lectin domain-containing protein n=1 Tax=Aromia moschata TaxID=1265417 RepID=A0AAV8XPQ3_9CUCU|nr:hypothetical protein NQ318_012960 [Aromia moschata]
MEQRVNFSCGNECLSCTQVFEWFKRFKEGRETIEDDSCPGRPSTSKTDENIEKIGKSIPEDRRLSIRGLAEITGIDKECVRQILHESFNMRKNVGASDRRFWTSGTMLPDNTNWIWMSTGKPITYTNWLPKQPDNAGGNEKCLELRYGNNLMWSDVVWTTANLVICEASLKKDNSKVLTGITNCNLTLINVPPK